MAGTDSCVCRVANLFRSDIAGLSVAENAKGVKVSNVNRDGAADRCGFRVGDVIDKVHTFVKLGFLVIVSNQVRDKAITSKDQYDKVGAAEDCCSRYCSWR